MLFNKKIALANQNIITIPDKLAWSTISEKESVTVTEAGQSANNLLILIIILLFISERIFAFYRRQ
jgi:hypothetical protein